MLFSSFTFLLKRFWIMTYVLAEYPDSTPQYWVASCDPKVPSDALEGITQITPDTHLAPKMIWSGTDA